MPGSVGHLSLWFVQSHTTKGNRDTTNSQPGITYVVINSMCCFVMFVRLYVFVFREAGDLAQNDVGKSERPAP